MKKYNDLYLTKIKNSNIYIVCNGASRLFESTNRDVAVQKMIELEKEVLVNIQELAINNLKNIILDSLKESKKEWDKRGYNARMSQKLMNIFLQELDVNEIALNTAIESVEKFYKKIGDVDFLELDVDLCGYFIKNGEKTLINTFIAGGVYVQIEHYRTTFKKVK